LDKNGNAAERISKLVIEIRDHTLACEEASKAARDARAIESRAISKLSDLHKEFDQLTAEMKKLAPHDTSWRQNASESRHRMIET
jgi:K+/H+ antiporter YhaU regulatory subunit KhtT